MDREGFEPSKEVCRTSMLPNYITNPYEKTDFKLPLTYKKSADCQNTDGEIRTHKSRFLRPRPLPFGYAGGRATSFQNDKKSIRS